MTNIEKRIVNFFIKWEGGYVNDKNDKGGPTNRGITLSTFRAYFGNNKTINDLKNMSDTQWLYIFKQGFYDKIKCSEVKNENIQLIWCDWFWGSGSWGIKKVQTIVGVEDDGIVGEKTIEAINKYNPKDLFNKIKASRIAFYYAIVKNNPSQKKFLNGWLNRVNDISYL